MLVLLAADVNRTTPISSNLPFVALQVTWRVDEVQTDKDEASFTMAAHLPHTALDVARRFSLKSGTGVVTVSETLTNLVGFQRALGRAQHVTIGEAFLRGGDTVFRLVKNTHQQSPPRILPSLFTPPPLLPSPQTYSTNADRGHTWPDELDDSATWARDVDFDYPKIPAAAAGASPLDWRRYPRTEVGSLDRNPWPESQTRCGLILSTPLPHPRPNPIPKRKTATSARCASSRRTSWAGSLCAIRAADARWCMHGSGRPFPFS